MTAPLPPALAQYYDITLVTPEPDATDPELRARFEMRRRRACVAAWAMRDVTAWSDPLGGARQRWSGIAAVLLSGTASSDRGELLDWQNSGPVTT
jgi:hypothetical protein